jgi:beta-glucosidase
MKTKFFLPLLLLSFLVSVVSAQSVALKPVPVNQKWWTDRFDGNVKTLEAGDVGLLMIGDSITHGWDGQKAQWDKYFGQYKPVNMGFGGDRTEHVLWRLDHYPLDKIQPKVAVIMIGTNNIGHGSSTPKDAADGIKAIVEKLQKTYPAIRIIVLNVFPRDEKPDGKLRAKVNEINSYLPALLKGTKNVTLFEIKGFLDKDNVLPKNIMPDSLHPNAAGYTIWGDQISPLLKKKFDEKDKTAKPVRKRINLKRGVVPRPIPRPVLRSR